MGKTSENQEPKHTMFILFSQNQKVIESKEKKKHNI